MTKLQKSKKERDNGWIMAKQWGFPREYSGPNTQEEMFRKDSRKPLDEKTAKVRRDHMTKLHNEGASYAIIGRLYSLSRKQVRNIVLGLSNN